MSLIYITGPSGAGKSTVSVNLSKLGYKTYDTDNNNIRYWLDKATGEPLSPYKIGAEENTILLNDNNLGIPLKWLNKVKQEGADSITFICGTSPIDHTETGIYDKIILLIIDEKTLIYRLKNRVNNNYGKKPEQLEKAVKWHKETINRYRKLGAYEIDATQPLHTIVTKIVNVVNGIWI